MGIGTSSIVSTSGGPGLRITAAFIVFVLDAICGKTMYYFADAGNSSSPRSGRRLWLLVCRFLTIPHGTDLKWRRAPYRSNAVSELARKLIRDRFLPAALFETQTDKLLSSVMVSLWAQARPSNVVDLWYNKAASETMRQAQLQAEPFGSWNTTGSVRLDGGV